MAQSTTDISRLAQELIATYGIEAEMVALHRAGILQGLENRAEAEFWWRISEAVTQLLGKA